MEAGRVTLATVADHFVRHRGDFTALRLGRSRYPAHQNSFTMTRITIPIISTVGTSLRRLCADCHDRMNKTNAPRTPVHADGTPSDPKHPCNAGDKARSS